MIYDEGYHFRIIKIFSHQLSPIISDQPTKYDVLRDLNATSLLYHYLLSWPYRLIHLFTNSQGTQVILLRLVNVLLAASGLAVFARVFRVMGLRPTYINVGLLMFVLLPIVPFVAATINYDNLLFLLTAAYFFVCVRILKSSKVEWHLYSNLIILGMFASLAKFTFLPIFAASIAFLAIYEVRRFGKSVWFDFASSVKSAARVNLILSAVVIVALGAMFSAIYIRNVVEYHTPKPGCATSLSLKRCLASSLVRRGVDAKATAYKRPALPLSGFTEVWFEDMQVATNWSGNTTTAHTVAIKPPLPMMRIVLFFGSFVAFGVLLLAWRELPKNICWYFFVAMAAVLVLAVFSENLSTYRSQHYAYAVQPRYLLSVVPVMFVMVVAAAAKLLSNRPRLKLTSLLVALLMFTQGGGVITHILRSDDSWYWQNGAVLKANHAAKKLLQPMVKE
jgi:hypothetical protein